MWHKSAVSFLQNQLDSEKGAARSTPNGMLTLYGTCYVLLGMHYLGVKNLLTNRILEFLLSCQDPESGLLIGPELNGFQSPVGVLHDFEHLSWHSTCTALPLLQEYDLRLARPVRAAHFLMNKDELADWLVSRNLKNAWFEGNNILFAGQFLIYLRDVENRREADLALEEWFDWLDRKADPKTGLWGTDGFCSPMEAVYGGYHQLLVYYYEDHPLPNIRGLVDTVLSLQHHDGGFNPNGNGGACEDVDSVDILTNCYKRLQYRRAEIRFALRRCLHHILKTQNSDGGFPYNRDQPQSHMGIPGTEVGPNVSCTFPTWFRIHTLALIAEILPDEPELKGIPFRFNKYLSMGWHQSPKGWQRPDINRAEDLIALMKYRTRGMLDAPHNAVRIAKRLVGRSLRKLRLRK